MAYSYDGFGRVSSQQTKKGSGTVLARAYAFSQGKTSAQTTGQVASLTVTGSVQSVRAAAKPTAIPTTAAS